jgi:hypothetical protein
MPRITASIKPVVTRKSEATRSPSSRPVRISSPRPFATASGEGKTDSGKTCNSQSADHMAMAATRTITGSRRALEASGVSVIEKLCAQKVTPQSAERTTDNCPAVHCWVKRQRKSKSVKRTVERDATYRLFQSSVSRTAIWFRRNPTDKSVGYYDSSANADWSIYFLCKAVIRPTRTAHSSCVLKIVVKAPRRSAFPTGFSLFQYLFLVG